MAMPYAHLDRLAALPTEAAHELIELAQLSEKAIERLYRPTASTWG
jgi:ATP adenylyltransferase